MRTKRKNSLSSTEVGVSVEEIAILLCVEPLQPFAKVDTYATSIKSECFSNSAASNCLLYFGGDLPPLSLVIGTDFVVWGFCVLLP